VLDETEFSYPRPNLIVSRRGYTVDVARSAIRYEEAGRTMEIFSEWLVGPDPKIAVRRRDLRAWEGDKGAELTEADRLRIVENIRRAFVFKDWTLVIED
jgi:hypothetical protein